jgi:hypothetical protein
VKKVEALPQCTEGYFMNLLPVGYTTVKIAIVFYGYESVLLY